MNFIFLGLFYFGSHGFQITEESPRPIGEYTPDYLTNSRKNPPPLSIFSKLFDTHVPMTSQSSDSVIDADMNDVNSFYQSVLNPKDGITKDIVRHLVAKSLRLMFWEFFKVNDKYWETFDTSEMEKLTNPVQGEKKLYAWEADKNHLLKGQMNMLTEMEYLLTTNMFSSIAGTSVDLGQGNNKYDLYNYLHLMAWDCTVNGLWTERNQMSNKTVPVIIEEGSGVMIEPEKRKPPDHLSFLQISQSKNKLLSEKSIIVNAIQEAFDFNNVDTPGPSISINTFEKMIHHDLLSFGAGKINKQSKQPILKWTTEAENILKNLLTEKRNCVDESLVTSVYRIYCWIKLQDLGNYLITPSFALEDPCTWVSGFHGKNLKVPPLDQLKNNKIPHKNTYVAKGNHVLMGFPSVVGNTSPLKFSPITVEQIEYANRAWVNKIEDQTQVSKDKPISFKDIASKPIMDTAKAYQVLGNRHYYPNALKFMCIEEDVLASDIATAVRILAAQ